MGFLSVKYMAIGLILGLFVGCGWIAIRYIMQNKLRVADDLTSVYGLPVIGQISGEKKKAKWFQSPYDAYTNEEQLDLIAANVKVLMERQEKHKVFLTGDSGSERCRNMTQQLASRLNAQGLQCGAGQSVAYDLGSISRINEAEAVVLVEQIDVSRYELIGKEKELCANCWIPVLGSVVVE